MQSKESKSNFEHLVLEYPAIDSQDGNMKTSLLSYMINQFFTKLKERNIVDDWLSDEIIFVINDFTDKLSINFDESSNGY